MENRYEEGRTEYRRKYGVEFPKWPTKYKDLDEVITDRFACEPTDSEIVSVLTEWELHTDGEAREVIQTIRKRINEDNENCVNLFSADDELERLREENANLRLELIEAQEKYAKKDMDIKRELVRAYCKIEDLQRDLDLMLDDLFSTKYTDQEEPEIVRYNYRFQLVEHKKKATA